MTKKDLFTKIKAQKPMVKSQASYKKLREFILGELETKLSPDLTYHGIHHTMDVLDQVNKSLRHYNITGHEAELVRIATLAHDLGFTVKSANHEETGAQIMQKLMPLHGYTKTDFELVRGMILATKIPQSPKNLFEQILCDADLDYLGRKDFDDIAPTLFEEWNRLGFISNDPEAFDKIQVKFLSSHNYHTDFTNKKRAKIKARNLKKLQNRLATAY